MYVKDSIRSAEVNMTTSHTVSAWCEVALKDNDKLLVGVVYRSPASTYNDNNKLLNVLTEAVHMKTSHVLIFGDFNYTGIDWDTQTSVASVNEQECLYYFRDSFYGNM